MSSSSYFLLTSKLLFFFLWLLLMFSSVSTCLSFVSLTSIIEKKKTFCCSCLLIFSPFIPQFPHLLLITFLPFIIYIWLYPSCSSSVSVICLPQPPYNFLVPECVVCWEFQFWREQPVSLWIKDLP